MPNPLPQCRFACYVLCSLVLVVLSACGASHMAETLLPDFNLSLGSSSVAVGVGATQNLTLSATSINGFSGPVNVAIGGLPAGVTASPSTLTLTPGGNAQTVVLSASGNASAASATVTITASSGTVTHAATVGLTVTPATAAPDFTLTLAPASIAVPQGGTGKAISVNAVPMNGFSGTVNVHLSGLPSGVTTNPSTLSLKPGTAQSVTLTAAAGAATGDASVTVTGTAASVTHTAALSLSVTEAPPENLGFALTVTPASLTVTQGGAGKTVSVNAVSRTGFSGTVNVKLSGLPAGVTASPSTLSLTPDTAQSVTLIASAKAAVGNATVTFTGTSRSLKHSATLALTVAAASATPDFTLSPAPSSIAVTQGATGQVVSVNATPTNGFSGSVKVSLSGLPSGVTANPSTLNLTPGTAQNTTVTAAANAATGNANVTLTGTSGSLTHTASLKLAVNAAPAQPKDFTLALTPPSLTLTQGATGQAISVNADPANGFSATVHVALSGLPSGVTADPSSLSLTPGTPQNVTLTSAANAATGNATVTFTGTAASLTHTAGLTLTVAAAPPSSNGVDVTTYHYDNARDGLNANEKVLTTANVNSNSFGKLGLYSVDGKVDAVPLYLSKLSINGGTHNVLYAVTEHDSIYAFDADSGAVLWQKSALGTGETPSDNHGCGQISPEIGITDTPVIDRKLGAIFFVAMSLDGKGAYHQRLHALNLATGAEMQGGPSEITASYPGTGEFSQNGMQIFDPAQYAERVGLLLMNGSLFLGWTSHCDIDPYTGWLMMYNETTLKQTSVLNLTANGPKEPHYEGGEGSIWQAGAGLAGDTQGNVYFLDANGIFDTSMNGSGFPSQGDYGNSFMKVSSANGKLTPADYFAVYNTLAESLADHDLGSGGVLLLPDMTDANGATLHLAVGAGKDGNIYLVNRDKMGKFNSSANNIYQELPGAVGPVFGMAAYFNNAIYYGSINDVLQAFTLQDAKLNTPASSQSSTVFGFPGTTPSISANGTQNGIVWAVENATLAVLHAYDASNLGHELYNSSQAPNGRDNFGAGNKFITPMIINGKVYVGTPNGVAVFGLLH
jgi:hypothetical protein